jgi:hypothetical protein
MGMDFASIRPLFAMVGPFVRKLARDRGEML